MAFVTRGDVLSVLRAPYDRTLWTYLHLQQQERLDDLRDRGRTLYSASLVTLAFHEPKRLTEEHRKLQMAAGLLATPNASRAAAMALVAEVEKIDHAGAWKPMGGIA